MQVTAITNSLYISLDNKINSWITENSKFSEYSTNKDNIFIIHVCTHITSISLNIHYNNRNSPKDKIRIDLKVKKKNSKK